jgi:hypothetical protein
MEISVALILFLSISVILILQLRSPAPPQPSQPLTALTGSTGKKRRKTRRKPEGLNGGDKVVAVPEKQGAKHPPLPLFWLSGALKRRITEQYFEGLSLTKRASFYQVDMFFF